MEKAPARSGWGLSRGKLRAPSVEPVLPGPRCMMTGRVLALTPALLVVVACNGSLEELVFRGLSLRKYNAVFSPYLANVLQAAIFALAHVGVSYTPFALLFIALIVFPLGVLCGFLMRSSHGIVASSLFHAGADTPSIWPSSPTSREARQAMYPQSVLSCDKASAMAARAAF